MRDSRDLVKAGLRRFTSTAVEPSLKKKAPCSLCLSACPKWNLGLREQQGLGKFRLGNGRSQRRSRPAVPDFAVGRKELVSGQWLVVGGQ